MWPEPLKTVAGFGFLALVKGLHLSLKLYRDFSLCRNLSLSLSLYLSLHVYTYYICIEIEIEREREREIGHSMRHLRGIRSQAPYRM